MATHRYLTCTNRLRLPSLGNRRVVVTVLHRWLSRRTRAALHDPRRSTGGLGRAWPARVHAQHVEAGLDQALGRLPVEVHFGMAAAWGELKAVVWSALVEPFRDDFRVGFEDHGQVGPVSLGVELPEE